MLLLHTGREEGRRENGGGILRIVFDIDNGKITYADGDIPSHIQLTEIDGKQRVVVVIEIPDDLMMDRREEDE